MVEGSQIHFAAHMNDEVRVVEELLVRGAVAGFEFARRMETLSWA